MSATIQLTFGSFALSSANNITIKKIAEKSSKPVKTVNIPNIDGAISEEAKIGPKNITIEGDIVGSSYDSLRSNLDALHAALLNGIQKLTKDNERYIYCQLKDFSYAYDHMTRSASWAAQFIAHFPFWLAETAETDTRSPATATPYNLWHGGNAPTRVKVEITANGAISDAFKLENSTAGKTFQYRGTIAAAKTVEIDNRFDSDDFQVLNDGTADMTNFEGDFPIMEAGSNTFSPTWASSGSTAPVVKMTWRKCWY